MKKPEYNHIEVVYNKKFVIIKESFPHHSNQIIPFRFRYHVSHIERCLRQCFNCLLHSLLNKNMTTCQSKLRNKHKQFKCLPPIEYSYNFRYFSINFYFLLIPQLPLSLQKPNYRFLKFEKYIFLGMNFIEQRIFQLIKRLFKCFVKHPKKYVS